MNKTQSHTSQIIITILTLSFMFSIVGCGGPYSVKKSNMTRYFKEHQQNALNSNHPSELSLQYLRLQNMEDLYEHDQEDFFVQFTDHVLEARNLQAARVMAELSLLEGRRQSSHDMLEDAVGSYLTAAETAYRYLMNSDLRTADAAMSPDYRFITQIYNAAVAELVELYMERKDNWKQKETYQTSHTIYESVLVKPSQKVWDPDAFDELVSAYEIKTKGLRNRYFHPGMGAAMIGVVNNPSEKVHWGEFFADQKAAYPVTVMLIFDPPKIKESKRYITGKMIFYNPLTVDHITLEDQKIPLEIDYSSPLVIQLEHLNPSSMGLSGMFHSDKKIDDVGLFLLEPYNPDKIPVLMVHGLMSTPATWMNMFNDLRGCPEIRDRYQFWFFSYPTGLPILYSSSLLRQKLLDIQKQLDSEQSNPNFNSAVLIGHSMGGLLSRVMMQDSGTIYYDHFFSEPFDQLSLNETSRELLEQSLFFESIPFFQRVIFVCAPHRGAPMADYWVSKFANDLIDLPGNVANTTKSVLSDTDSLNQEVYKKHKKIRMQSIGNLSATSPFCEAYNKVPVRSDVPYHSIIGIRDAETGPSTSDGVVPYESSHIDFSVSEKWVASDHQAPQHPHAIDEVKRILLLHLQEID